ncbi:unnamed protein product [Cyprideis torosa]|uniref:F-box domain-containing protein n=1 Tax=Cyprideis torosa TaxID=163714 RepID=A0A7R8ZQI7_9CRUS|nr:unnamed protein product [Cyprideis torosa]CAG0890764.1 unnamed protein product [Cyprideis torosa]
MEESGGSGDDSLMDMTGSSSPQPDAESTPADSSSSIRRCSAKRDQVPKDAVDINEATVDILSSLAGVGRSKAEAIVQTRESLGGFTTVEDLLLCPGIGRSLLELNRTALLCRVRSSSGAPGASLGSGDAGSLLVDAAAALHSRRRKSAPSPSSPQGSTSSSSSSRQTMTPSPPQGKNGRALPHHSASLSKPSEESMQVEEGRMDTPSAEEDFKGPSTRSILAMSMDEEEEEEEDGETDSPSPRGCEDSPSPSALPPQRYPSLPVSSCLKKDGDTTSRLSSKDGGNGVSFLHRSHSSVANPSPQQTSTVGLPGGERMDQECGDSTSASKMRITNSGKRVMIRRRCKSGSSQASSSLSHAATPASSPLAGDSLCSSRSVGSSGAASCEGYPPSRGSKRPCASSPDAELSAEKSRVNAPGLTDWLVQYDNWTPSQRITALNALIEAAETNEIRHMMRVIEPQFQRDFISLLPKELALYVLCFLRPPDLLKASQTCRYWRILAEDNILWREKCQEAGIADWKKVVHERTRVRTVSPVSSSGSSAVDIPSPSPWKAAFLRLTRIETNWRSHPIKRLRVLKGHDDHVITCLQFSGHRIVSGSDDNTLKVWSAITGKCLRTLTGHTGGVWSSQMSGSIVVSGSTDRTLKVWDADNGECVHTLYGHTSTVRCMHLHGNKVVSGSRDASLRMWDINTGRCLHVLQVWISEHVEIDPISCMELKDNILVSGNADSTVKVWNVLTGQCLQTLSDPTKLVCAVGSRHGTEETKLLVLDFDEDLNYGGYQSVLDSVDSQDSRSSSPEETIIADNDEEWSIRSLRGSPPGSLP